MEWKRYQFVRKISLAVFGKETLMKSTISGKKSNRNKSDDSPLALDTTKLPAIYDTYRYWLKKERKYSQNRADFEGMETFNYISRQIGDLKCNKKKKTLRKVKPKRSKFISQEENLEDDLIEKNMTQHSTQDLDEESQNENFADDPTDEDNTSQSLQDPDNDTKEDF